VGGDYVRLDSGVTDTLIDLHEEVRASPAEGRPVVALEPSVIAQGLPRPQNLEVARSVEDTVRAGGATPATIAVIQGRLRIGLDVEEIERLASSTCIAKCGAGISAGRWRARAVAAGTEQGLVGKALTPFLLARIADELGPRALRANRALLLNNARIGTAVARVLCERTPR
jgi:pseudouridine-5'-phosphate glycosidase